MSAPLDVLAVAVMVTESNGLTATAEGLRDARAAVAELVEAASRVATNRPRTSPQINADWDSLRAALAKFGGAA